MIQKLKKQLLGYIKIKITGGSPERFLNLCKHKEIEIWNLESKKDSYEMLITIHDFRMLKPILKKTNTRIRILERYGVPFFLHKYRKRKFFFSGVIVCLFVVLFLSRFVWGIDINGNQTITDDVLLEFLKTQDVYHGMSRKKIKCESIVTSIRKEFDEIIWVSVSLEGCNVIINIKENSDTFQVNKEVVASSDIISTAEGVIVEIITRSGVPYVKIGDHVKTGDLLVSGTLEIKNDAGEIMHEENTTADADVLAEVELEYHDVCDKFRQEKKYTKLRYKEIYLNILGYHMKLGIRKNIEQNYESITEETQLRIGENFHLPIVFGEYRGKGYELENSERTKQQMEEILKENIDTYIKELEDDGVEVLKKEIQLKETKEGMKANGVIKVKQSIVSRRKSVDL